MCGRYTLTTPADVLVAMFNLGETPSLIARYNIAPTQPVSVVRVAPEKGRVLETLIWGLLPWFSKDPKPTGKMINARKETLASNPAFKKPFEKQRCLVPADGFYEWKALGGKKKQPYWIHRKDQLPFAFAGIWDRRGRGESAIETCAVITTTPSKVMAPIHDRMPAIVRPEDFDAWLDPNVTNPEQLSLLLTPYEDLIATPVGDRVGKPDNDDPSLICEVPAQLGGLFD